MKRFKFASLAYAVCLLSGCSIEPRDAETIVSDPQVVFFSNPAQQDFYDRAHRCVLGEIKFALPLEDLFFKSLQSSDEDFLYQDPTLTRELEKCLRKSDLTLGGKLYINYIPVPRVCAKIAQAFLIKEEYEQSAFWMRRIYNQLGRMNGNELAGNIFVEDPRTLNIGAAMLSEAAKLGSQSASLRLIELASGN